MPLIKGHTLERALIPVPDNIPISCIARMTENMTRMVNCRHKSCDESLLLAIEDL